jgi:hypothetical protein
MGIRRLSACNLESHPLACLSSKELYNTVQILFGIQEISPVGKVPFAVGFGQQDTVSGFELVPNLDIPNKTLGATTYQQNSRI